MRRRSLFFWPLVAACLVLGVWWVLYVPYAPQRMYAAIPSGATFVSQHLDLVERWDAFSRNPVTRSLLSSAGLKASELKDLTEDPESRAWFRKLASRDVVVAFVPALGDFGEPAWVFASWIGGRSQRLRWTLSWQHVPGYTRIKPHRGRPCWRVSTPDLDPGLTVTISFVEGMLVGCVAKSTRAIGDVLDACDGLQPSMARREDFPSSGAWCSNSGALDRGWVDMAHLGKQGEGGLGTLAYEFSDLTPTSLVGLLCGPVPALPATAPGQASDSESLGRLFGDLPLALGVARTALLMPLVDETASPAWARVVRDVVKREGSETAAVALFGGEYGGRFKAIKVPAIVVGIPVANAEQALARVAEALDRLNARYRWGLIPRDVAVGSNHVYAIEGTAVPSYAVLTLEEKPAYAVCGGWLLLASNLGSLGKLVARYAEAGAVPTPRAAAWTRGADAAGNAPCYGWIDLVQGGKTVRLAITTYSLKLFLEDPEGTHRARQRLNEVKAWIDALAPLKNCRFWITPRRETIEVRFSMGT